MAAPWFEDTSNKKEYVKGMLEQKEIVLCAALKEFYARRNPAKLHELDKIIQNYHEGPFYFHQDLLKRYGETLNIWKTNPPKPPPNRKKQEVYTEITPGKEILLCLGVCIACVVFFILVLFAIRYLRLFWDKSLAFIWCAIDYTCSF